ncbi:MAG: 4-alpha-glucanotransferase, partial [Clostridia bacterium]|nr:4-alpha-glucanotransferase [Clostridia bacterium]
MDPEKSPLSPRVAGVLLSVSSLPSPFGIGTLGREAFSFVDFLAAAGQKLWQVLPINPTSYGDSPYQSPASLSGNPLYIDPALLSHEGLLTSEELESAKDDATRVDYGKLFATRFPLLKTAFSRADKKDPAFLDFCRENEAWLSDYALFMTLKEEHDYKAWYLWDEEHKDYARARALIPQKAEEMRFWQWVQYEFMKEWNALHRYANEKGIRIVGDMPIYVAHDSMDVWRAREEFLLDDAGYPTKVAGCPPDAFAKNGQLWGNPLYRWDKMEREGFPFWIARMRANLSLF